MHLLQAGVDITIIALWLGHENPVTTHGYVEADLTMKQAVATTNIAKPATPHTLRHYIPFLTMSCNTAMARCLGLLLEVG